MTVPKKRKVGSLLRWAGMSSAIVLVTVFSAPSRGAEIATYRDASGRTVYVTQSDTELRAVVRRAGVEAGLRLIDQRRQALPGIEQWIDQICKEQRIDPKLARAVIEVESAWNVRARSRKGALGLMQLMPDTAARFNVRDAFDARDNVRAGVTYLRALLDRFDQDLVRALAAYNAGERAVAARDGVPPYPETQAYVARIRALYGNPGPARPASSAISRTVVNGRAVYSNLY